MRDDDAVVHGCNSSTAVEFHVLSTLAFVPRACLSLDRLALPAPDVPNDANWR
eukprot:SAG11_NODE_36332_length_262_cov_0.631902_1_plen_52_part_01